MAMKHRPLSAESRNAWGSMDQGVVNPGANMYDDDCAPAAMESEIYRNRAPDASLASTAPPENLGAWGTFKRGVRSIWMTRQTEDTTANKELHIKTTLRELIIYIIFIALLCIITFCMTSATMFYYTNVLTTLFVNTPGNPTNPGSNYAGINLPGDWFQYTYTVLIPGLYTNWESWYNSQNVTASAMGYVYYENKILGVPRIRQLRVRNNSCIVPSDFQSQIKVCFGPYSSSGADTTPFGLMNGTAWTYSTDAQLDGSSYTAQVSSYPGGGYYLDLETDSELTIPLIDTLYQNLWIDRGTRVVFTDFTVYNANINLFCVIKLVVEYPATGGAIPSYSMRTVKLIRYVSTLDFFVLACEAFFCLFILYYIVEEAIEIYRLRLAYLKEFWNILDIIVLLISICCIAFNVYRTVAINNMLDKLLVNPNSFADFDFLSYWQIVFNSALAVMAFFAWIKIFKYISFNKTMTQLSETLSACSKDLFGFAIMFMIIFLAFAQLGYLLFGTQVVDFSSFETAIFTLFRIILGDFNFTALQQANRILGPAYFILYVFFVFFVLLNMFLAIINDTYSEVKAELDEKENEFEMGDYFKQKAQGVLGKLTSKKDRIKAIQNALKQADTNNDREIDFEELRHDLKMRGYAEAEIEAVFSKYDLDGDRRLDEAELRQMQADLEGQQNQLTQQINTGVKGGGGTGGGVGGGAGVDPGDGSVVVNGVAQEEFTLLQRRVDRMEHSIGSIVSKIDAVLIKLESMEIAKAKRRETMSKLLDSISESQDSTDEMKRQQMERLVREEIEKWDTETALGGGAAGGGGRGPSPPSGGRGASPRGASGGSDPYSSNA